MENSANMGAAKVSKPPSQFINKTITETVVVGPDNYPRDATGNILKVVSTGDGKGDFSHSLTDRQVSQTVGAAGAITYTRSYTIPVQNPKWAAAKGRANMNALANMFGKTLGGKRKTRRSKRAHHSRRKSRRN